MKLTKSPFNPVLSPNPNNAWESLVTCNPGAWFENGLFYLLYRAAGNDIEHTIHLGLATSTDGVSFTRVSDQPVMSPTPDNFDEGCVEDPRIVKFGDLFYVTYAYRPFVPGRYWEKGHRLKPKYDLDDHAPSGLRWNTTNSALAVSKDLRTFKKLGRITKYNLDNRDVILFPEKVNGRFVMLHRPVEWTGPNYGCDVPSIWLAFSDNLMEWKDDFLLLSASTDWDDKKLGGATPPIKTDQGWLVLYHGVSKKDDLYRIGAMILDLDDPRKILAKTKDFIMEPEYDYETNGFYNGCVFPTGNVVVGDTLYVYYGGADRYVCLATCKVKELVRFIFENS